MSNEREKDELLSEHIWKWIVRLVILALIGYWVFNGLEPTERWIGLITILLSFNEFRIKRSKDGEGGGRSFSISLRESKKMDGGADKEGPESSSIHSDCTSMVAKWAIG